MIRIGIDAHVAGKQKGGVETCVVNIVRALARLDRANRYFIYVGPDHPFGRELPPNFELRRLPVTNPWIERALWMPVAYRQDRLDVLHLHRASPFWGCPRCVLHVHDLMYETRSDLFPRWKRLLLNPVFRRSARRATAIATVSEAAKRDIVGLYGVPPDRVTVISNGVDLSDFGPLEPGVCAGVLARWNLDGPYAIVLGMIDRNKNVHTAVEAFAAFLTTHPEYRLVLVGRERRETRGGYLDEVLERADKLGCRERVIVTGYVPDAERRALLACADMLLFPATSEGFGLPPLEAMACGVPAVVADTAVAWEIYAGAALYARPLDPADMAMCMKQLADSAGIRDVLVQRGYERCGQFSWDAVAVRLLDLYRHAASS